jgi:hypothetical protein
MIAGESGSFDWYRLTEKGAAWLEAADLANRRPTAD